MRAKRWLLKSNKPLKCDLLVNRIEFWLSCSCNFTFQCHSFLKINYGCINLNQTGKFMWYLLNVNLLNRGKLATVKKKWTQFKKNVWWLQVKDILIRWITICSGRKHTMINSKAHTWHTFLRFKKHVNAYIIWLEKLAKHFSVSCNWRGIWMLNVYYMTWMLN